MASSARIKEVAAYILSDACQGVAVLSGAGISVAAGIPDFRSPGGMYSTLRPELLTATEEQRRMMRLDPTAVVSTSIFYRNQFPYMELRRPFIVGTADCTWKATTGHWFLRLLQEKGKLVRLYTQNIDGLDFQVGLPADKIVTVHGNLRQIRCESCGAAYPSAEFVQAVRENIKDIYGLDAQAPAESREIPCLQCGRPQVKPATVLFGGSLPDGFFQSAEQDFPDEVDLLFVIGTSLVVGPANSLVRMVKPQCKRVVINREPVGQELGIHYETERDVFLSGDCETSITALIDALGWQDDLRRLQANASPSE